MIMKFKVPLAKAYNLSEAQGFLGIKSSRDKTLKVVRQLEPQRKVRLV